MKVTRKITPYLMILVMLAISVNIYSNDEIINTESAKDSNVTLTNQDTITVGDEKVNDIEIQKRLSDVYSNIESLRDVHISVEAGVATLTGKTYNNQAYEKALQLANRTEGVIGINNNIIQENNVTKRLADINNKLASKSSAIYQNLPIYLLALAVFVLFWVFSLFSFSVELSF